VRLANTKNNIYKPLVMIDRNGNITISIEPFKHLIKNGQYIIFFKILQFIAAKHYNTKHTMEIDPIQK